VSSLHSPVEPAGAWALQVMEIRMPVAINDATTRFMFISRNFFIDLVGQRLVTNYSTQRIDE
jgi:hypothetical protein